MNGFPPLEDPDSDEPQASLLDMMDMTETDEGDLVSKRAADAILALSQQDFDATELQDLAGLIIDSLIEMLATVKPDSVTIETITRLTVAHENLMYASFEEEDENEEDQDPNTVFTDPIVLN